MKLNEKIMLVTGASSGIGAATAKAAAAKGAKLVLLARTKSKLEDVAGEIKDKNGTAEIFPVDLTDSDAVAQTADEIKKKVGVPDIIFNNAGAGKWMSILDTSPEDMEKMMASPYFAAFYVTKAFLPEIIERNSGYFITMTSAVSTLACPNATAYVTARWAMRGFHEALTADFTGTNIRTMLVTFAKVQSSYWNNNPGSEAKVPKAQSMIPILTPEQTADAIVKGIEANKNLVAEPFMLRLFMLLNQYFPNISRWYVNRGTV